MVVAGGHPRWRDELPSGAAALTKELLVASNQVLWRGEAVYRFAASPVGRKAVERGADIYEGLVARKSFINRHVITAIEAGARQVAVIGAGFDTLCLRLASEFPEVLFVEIDHPATAPAKHRGVEAIGKPDNLELVVTDLSHTPLGKALVAAEGWDAGLRSVFIAEGLLMYLSEEQIEGLAGEVGRSGGPGSRLLVTHLTDLNVAGRFSRFWVGLIGEPWLSAHTRDQLRAFMQRLGWSIVEQDEPRAGRNLEGFAALERSIRP